LAKGFELRSRNFGLSSRSAAPTLCPSRDSEAGGLTVSRLQARVAVITQRLNRLSPQKPRIEISPWMNRVTFITDERQIGVVRSVVKRRLLVRVPTTG